MGCETRTTRRGTRIVGVGRKRARRGCPGVSTPLMNGGFAFDIFEVFGSIGMEVRMPKTPMLQGADKFRTIYRAYDDTLDLRVRYLQRS